MRALGKLKAEPGLWMYDAKKPVIGALDVLVRVQKAAICGTDLHIYQWDEWAQETIPVPLTIGHEFYGIVEEVGDAVLWFKPGDRVSGEGHIVCEGCRSCRAGRKHHCRNTLGTGIQRPGCFADYISMPASNLIALPKEVTDEVASFLDPLGNAVHSALSFDLVGEDVLITGAGPIGCMAVAIAKKAGARHVVITDMNEYRLALADKMGATRSVHIKKEKLSHVMNELGMKEGFDVGLEMSGSPLALRDMIEAMNYGGKIALLGILPDSTQISMTKVIFKSLLLKGIYGREMFETWYKTISLLQSGLDVKPIITHTFKAEEFEKAFEVMIQGEAGKVILDWS